MKRCPFCAEEIQDEAIICRFCNRDVRTPLPPPLILESPQPTSPAPVARQAPSVSPAEPLPNGTAAAESQRRARILGLVLAGGGFLATFVGAGGLALGFLLMWVGAALALPGSGVVRGGLGFVVALLLLTPAAATRTSSGRAIVSSSVPANPVGGPSAAPATSPASRDRFDIMSVGSRITESNDVWSKFAWKLVLRNNTSEPLSCLATIEFLDGDDFVVDDDSAYNLTVPASQEETFTGYDLLTAGVVHKVQKTQAKVNCR